MSTKTNPGEFNCYENADPDEEMFILLGRDRHAAALVRIWAELREKEGEAAAVVQEARECADRLEAYARNMGKPVLSLEALRSFFAVQVRGQRPQREETQQTGSAAFGEGEPVITTRGSSIGFVEKFIPAGDSPGEGTNPPRRWPDSYNVRYGREQVVTVHAVNLRRPTAQELEAHYNGRIAR